jgi:hypothetical protein
MWHTFRDVKAPSSERLLKLCCVCCTWHFPSLQTLSASVISPARDFSFRMSLWSMVRILGYRSGGPGSIHDTTKKKKRSWSGTGSTQPREYNWGATWQKSSSSCIENREYGRRDPSRWPRGTLYPQKLAIISPTSGGRSVGIVRSQTQTMEFVYLFYAFMQASVGTYPSVNMYQPGSADRAYSSTVMSTFRYCYKLRLRGVILPLPHTSLCCGV